MDDNIMSKDLKFENSCNFYQKRYSRISVTKEEYRFPLAYSIMAHNEFAQLEKLLFLIYSPANFYCIHVDQKSEKLIDQVKKLISCLQSHSYTNVFLATQLEMVYWGGIGVLKGTLNCLNDLIKWKWKYFLNLSAQDFPLKTNLELIRTLSSWDGANGVEVSEEPKKSRYLYHYATVYSKHGKHYPDSNIRTETLKSPPPGNLAIYKGNLAVALARESVEWILNNEPIINTYLIWLNDTDIPDEHFWATIFGNKRIFFDKRFILKLQAPYSVRYAVWRPSEDCGGKFIHDVCVFGVADLNGLIKKDYFFANKFYIGFESAAYNCLEMWFLNKRSRSTE